MDTALLTVDRGMQVLRAFRCHRAMLGNADLVQRTGLPKATVSRLTTTLLQVGFLRHASGGRKFELAAGPLAIGRSFLAGNELLRIATPHLQELAGAVDMSVALAVGHGLEMLYIGYEASPSVGTLRMNVGSVLPMGTTSIGHAHLWGLPAAERERQVHALTEREGVGATSIETAIRNSFAQLRTAGTCAVLGGHRPGTFGVALPVILGRQRVVMGLSCGKADVRPDIDAAQQRIRPALQVTAARLEDALRDIDEAP
jgi:DNA-binding IclR family transcriptional regulator